MLTGSDCTKRQLHLSELLDGTTATLRRIETGREVNPMTRLYAYVTQRTDSRTADVTDCITTLASNAQVAYCCANAYFHINIF